MIVIEICLLVTAILAGPPFEALKAIVPAYAAVTEAVPELDPVNCTLQVEAGLVLGVRLQDALN